MACWWQRMLAALLLLLSRSNVNAGNDNKQDGARQQQLKKAQQHEEQLAQQTSGGAAADASEEPTPTPMPVKVFILAGQSNMVGMASLEHLHKLINGTSPDGTGNSSSNLRKEKKQKQQEEPLSNEYRDTLWDEATQQFKVRDDVFVKYQTASGNLTVGPFASPDCFGPELLFGWTMGDALPEQPVYLIKTAWGGRDLAIDFRSPRSGVGAYQHDAYGNVLTPSHVGWTYRAMLKEIQQGLNQIAKIVPHYDAAAGYELAGFVFFQGYNDLIVWKKVDEYASNLANFIRDVRDDLQVPDLPFVIGELGMHGVDLPPDDEERHIRTRVIAMRHNAQSVTLRQEFFETTQYVPTAPYVVHDPTAERYNGEYHYFGRADTYFHIGQALARGMLDLLGLGQDDNDDIARSTDLSN